MSLPRALFLSALALALLLGSCGNEPLSPRARRALEARRTEAADEPQPASPALVSRPATRPAMPSAAISGTSGPRLAAPDPLEPTPETAAEPEAPAPVVQAPAPVVQAPAPVVQAPAPVVQAPAPVVQAPAPAYQDPDPKLAPEGQALFRKKKCHYCHEVRKFKMKTGPNLLGVGSRLAAEAMDVWIRAPKLKKPATEMPAFEGTDDQLAAIIAYLQSLK